MPRTLFTESTLSTTTTSSVVFTASSSEIDLRQWFDNLIYGTSGGTAHGHWLLIRHMRHSSNGAKIACSCLNALTNEASPTCPYCYAEGYLWDERWYLGYSAPVGPQGGLANKDRFPPPGVIKADYKAFYFRYDTAIKYGDKIVEVLLDMEGRIVVPYIRTNIHKPQTIAEYRSDNGRIEYFGIYCREEDALRPDVFEGVP